MKSLENIAQVIVDEDIEIREEIKETNRKIDDVATYAKEFGAGHVIDEDGEIYRVFNSDEVVPLRHPDLSTQPSILPERWGTKTIYERLISVKSGDFYIDGCPIECWAISFTDNKVAPIACHSNNGVLFRDTNIDFTEEYYLVKYVNLSNDYYYNA